MKFSAEVTGIDGLDEQLETLEQNAPNLLLDALNMAGILVVGYAQRSIMDHQSEGRSYRSGARVFVASLPGYPPNAQHGGAGFVGTIQSDVDDGELAVYVGTNDQRGPWFEFGTQHMQARPWLIPALEANQDAIVASITDALSGPLV